VETQISESEVTQAYIDSLKNSLYFRWPGVVSAYHASTQVADVQVTLADPRIDPDTGEIVLEPWPLILGVHVAWPRFGGFVFTGPLAPGDPVVLEAWDLDPSPALTQGRSAQTASPLDVRRHGGGYWLCRPTDMTGPIADAGPAGTMMIVGKDGDPAQIRMSAGSIQLGNAGGDFVALANLVKGELTKIASAMASGTVVMAAPGGAAVPVVYGAEYTTPGNVASALIKAQ
jgi:Phage protein Gp138 N-terminal domain